MKYVLFLSFFLSSLLSFGQGDQTIISVPIGANTKENAILHLPDDYNKTTTSYPLLVFLHGVGEGGTNPASIYNSSAAGGPAYFIAQGKFPSTFVNPADKKAYKFIVVSPQSTNGWSTTAPQLDTVLTSLIKTYRVDESRIYLTGISAGGEGVTEYVGQLQSSGVPIIGTHKIAAFIPMSAVMNASMEPGYSAKIVAGNIGIWAFGSPSDTHGANTLGLFYYTNLLKANYGVQTSYTGGHCCWGQFYDPNYRLNGMSMYEWMLQFSGGGNTAPPVVTPPVVSKVDSSGIINTYLKAHPCPTCPVCPVIDSAAIGKLYLLSHPCPVCPPPVICPAQRTVAKLVNDIAAGACYIIFSDGTTQQMK